MQVNTVKASTTIFFKCMTYKKKEESAAVNVAASFLADQGGGGEGQAKEGIEKKPK
jgi:hypothetical protein